jgi:hypothetical protein
MGTGQDVKLLTTRGGRVVLNRGKVVSEVSKSLGEDVARQLDEQLGGIRPDDVRGGSYRIQEESSRGEVMIFK